MTRDGFLFRLREGLRGVSPTARDEIIADYTQHFSDGMEAGRTEEEVAQALGDPTRLARELRAEIGLKRWEEERSPGAAAGAVFAVLGLGALDILILLPILLGVVSTLFAFFICVIFGFFFGGFIFAAGPFVPNVPGGPAVPLLMGLGIMSGSVAGTAILTLVTIGLVNALVWYGRLHFRLLKPATE